MSFLVIFLRSLSLRRLVLLGFALAVLPLIMAIVSAASAVEELAVMSQKSVYQVAQQTQKSRMLIERLTETERKGKQYLVLQDDTSREGYEDSHQGFQEVIASLLKLPSTDALVAAVGALSEQEHAVFQRITAVGPTAGVKEEKRKGKQDALSKAVGDSFLALAAQARQISSGYQEFVDQEAHDLDNRSREVQRRLFMQSSLLLPVSFGLISFFVYLIVRPIRRMDQAIRSLGSGDFSHPIRVVGPRDLEYLGERLEWLRNRLSSLEEAKQLFMRNVSHEIKTPLATIHEGTELLADEVVGELNPEQREIAQIMVSNTQRLDGLLAKLLNYSQLNARINQTGYAEVDMTELIRDQLNEYQIQFRAKNIVVKERLESMKVQGKAEQLRTIVDNLLSNAVKYSPPEGEIAITLSRNGKNGKSMMLEVEDDGPGIDPDERAHVFEPFFQGRAAREVGVKGTGFGLAIVSECVASHRGRVEALEPRGRKTGARIRILIPLQFDT
ncbi:sensor histidine kinase [Methyloterricola oryzae]|uniref:sensor histidine kinase n=1 Tax=Methyloterricola oryzae TaxID=1495050 RepID=UPI0005EBE7E2|nr:HAMP domain-containing sensor histidine kinase [Methyloterricola oryzae]